MLSAWDAWADDAWFMQQREKGGGIVLKAICRMLRAELHASLRVWIRFCRDAALRDHDVAVAALRQKEAALRATTLMRSSSARALAAAWTTWSTAVHRADVKESTIRRMIKRLVSRLTWLVRRRCVYSGSRRCAQFIIVGGRGWERCASGPKGVNGVGYWLQDS